MTKEQLEKILSNVWSRDWSADDASDAIWGEPFDGYTQPLPQKAETEKHRSFWEQNANENRAISELAQQSSAQPNH